MIKAALRKIFNPTDILKNLFNTVALAFIFFIASDYVFKTPELTGRWEYTTYPVTAKSKMSEVIQVTYTILIAQEGVGIKGVGEKMRAYIPPDNKHNLESFDENYDVGKRIRIEIDGHIEKNYLSKDKLTIYLNEAGHRRESSTVQVLTIEDKNYMVGGYISTISDSEGKIEWKRVSGSVQDGT